MRVLYIKNIMEQNYVYQCMLDYKIDITKPTSQSLPIKTSNDYKKNLEIQKIYCKKFKTDYAIMGDTDEYIKVVNFTRIDNKIES